MVEIYNHKLEGGKQSKLYSSWDMSSSVASPDQPTQLRAQHRVISKPAGRSAGDSMDFAKIIILGVCGGAPSDVVGVSRGWGEREGGGAFDTFQRLEMR